MRSYIWQHPWWDAARGKRGNKLGDYCRTAMCFVSSVQGRFVRSFIVQHRVIWSACRPRTKGSLPLYRCQIPSTWDDQRTRKVGMMLLRCPPAATPTSPTSSQPLTTAMVAQMWLRPLQGSRREVGQHNKERRIGPSCWRELHLRKVEKIYLLFKWKDNKESCFTYQKEGRFFRKKGVISGVLRRYKEEIWFPPYYHYFIYDDDHGDGNQRSFSFPSTGR